MNNAEKLPRPAVSAALGMAASYYGYPLLSSAFPGYYIILGFFFLIVVIVSFLRVFRSIQGAPETANQQALSMNKLGILVIAGAVGLSLGVAARRSVPDRAELGLQAERISAVSGILNDDPRTLQGGSGIGVLKLRLCAAPEGLRASARGNVTVFFPAESIPRLKEFGRGCEIYTDGVFSESERGLLFRAASVHVISPAPALEQFRTSLRVKVLEKFQSRQGRKTTVWGALASALLLGIRDNLDADLSDGFRNSGCSHILALSGMHLAIISGVLAFLVRRPLGIRWASMLGAVFIIFYVFAAGSQPSLVRAAIMYLIGTFALWGLLKQDPLTLLSMAFIIQLTFQSETGISYSFILSYLALGGILTLGETIRSLLRGRLPEILSVGLSASIGAFIVTSPVVALFFGSLKPIGILAGLFLAPLSSLFMVLALAALGVSFMPFPLWDVFNFILTWFYHFMRFMVSLIGRFPGFSVPNPVPVLTFAIVLWSLLLFIQRRDQAYRNSVASFD